MVKQLIKAFPKEKREAREDGSSVIHIAECFYDTVQGENFGGFPSIFLRLRRCTLNCVWCDTAEVWRKGNPYSVWELVELFEEHGLVERLRNGHHLILTGGSPVLQQDALIEFYEIFQEKYRFEPFVEIENECTLMPKEELFAGMVNLWNNSPKLANSEMPKERRYKPDVLKKLGELENSFFKFVVTSDEEWEEIKTDFIDTGLIRRDKIVLMPEGSTRDQLQKRYEWLVELCCRENVRMTDRLQVTVFNETTGV